MGILRKKHTANMSDSDSSEGSNFLEYLSSADGSLVLDQMEETIPMSSLHSADVVGLYFAAYSSPSCQEFTPKLAELYNECKDKNKKFEIVFVSSDGDEDAFNKYFIEMPWCALIFNERSVKEELSELFGVSGIPCLV